MCEMRSPLFTRLNLTASLLREWVIRWSSCMSWRGVRFEPFETRATRPMRSLADFAGVSGSMFRLLSMALFAAIVLSRWSSYALRLLRLV